MKLVESVVWAAVVGAIVGPVVVGVVEASEMSVGVTSVVIQDEVVPVSELSECVESSSRKTRKKKILKE